MTVTHKSRPLTYIYSMGKNMLSRVNRHQYLGVELASDLSWTRHINQIANKANQQLGLLRRNLYNCHTPTKAPTYTALVRLLLEYCHAVWDPCQQSSKQVMEKVQKRAARFACNEYSRSASVTNMMKRLGWERLERRRCQARLVIIYKETRGLIPSDIKHL